MLVWGSAVNGSGVCQAPKNKVLGKDSEKRPPHKKNAGSTVGAAAFGFFGGTLKVVPEPGTIKIRKIWANASVSILAQRVSKIATSDH